MKAPTFVSHLELVWRDPSMAHLLESLCARHRLVYFDARASGLFDRDADTISFDRAVDDLKSVFDAAKIERAPVLGVSQGGAIAAAFAARAPDRISAIVMLGSYPQGRAKRPSSKARELAKATQAMMAAGWDDEYPSLRDFLAETIVPNASAEANARWADDMGQVFSAENVGRYREMLDDLDVTSVLADVQAPCLIIHCKGDRMQPVEQGRKMAVGIPNAKFIALVSSNHIPPEYDPCWPLAEREIHSFLEEHQ